MTATATFNGPGVESSAPTDSSSDTRLLRLTVPQAGALLGKSPGAAYRAARAGELPGTLRLGRSFIVMTRPFVKALGYAEDTDPAALPGWKGGA